MGKDPDSQIQKSKKSKNYRGAPKVLDFWIYTVFFGGFWIFPKKPMVVFGFQGFLLLENLENPKKTYCFFFLIFPAFLEKSKKHKVFFGFYMVLFGKSKKTMVVFLIFKIFQKQKP